MITKKEYKAIAEIVRRIGQSYRGNYVHEWLANMLADYFEQENSQFDRQKFLEICCKESLTE